MAAPAYATDLTDISTDWSTNWNLITQGGGGQNALTAPERDDGIFDDGSGVVCASRNPFASSLRGVAYNRATITVATDDALFYWWKADVAAALDTFAGGGVRMVAGSSLTAYRQYYVAGSDTYAKGGWKCSPIDPTDAGDGDYNSPGTPDYDTFGVIFDVPSTGPSKGFPFKCSMIRHGRSVDVTAGDSGDPATWDKLAVYAEDGTRRWGIIQETPVGAEVQGTVNWGTASTAVYSRDTNRAIVFLDCLGFVATDFTELIFNHADTDVVWDGMTFTSLDPLNKGNIVINDNATVALTNCVFNDIGTTTDGGTNSVWDGSKWIGCEEVTAKGGSLLGCQFNGSVVTADTSALIYNETADPLGELDGCSFVSHATTAHHAIEFGLSSPTAFTLKDMTFTDFNAANSQNDSVLHFKRTSGTVTVTLSGMAQPSYKSDGATITFVVPAQTLTIKGVPSGAEWRLYDEDPADGILGSTELDGAESHGGGDITYGYTWSVDDPAILQVMADGFVEYLNYFDLTANDQTVNVVLTPETNT